MNHQSILQMARAPQQYRVSDNCFRVSLTSNLMGVDFPADGVCYYLRPNSFVGVDTQVAFLESLRIQFTCIDAFTSPVSVGRGLIVAGSFGGAVVSGFQQLGNPFSKQRGVLDLFEGTTDHGAYISDTGPIVGPVINPAKRLAYLSLAGFGNTGASIDKTFEFKDPVALTTLNGGYADQTSILIYSPIQMDAGGTWELVVEADVSVLPSTMQLPNL
jgi:hypothetical protein